MYRVSRSRSLNVHDAVRLSKRARKCLSGWVYLEPNKDGYVVVHISIQETSNLPEADEIGGWVKTDYPISGD